MSSFLDNSIIPSITLFSLVNHGSLCSSTMNSYPLMFHILILLATEGGLRVMMRFRGFQRLRVGPVSYYYHPGNSINSETFVNSDTFERENADAECLPIVFCHGIGVGLIFYMMLIDELMLLGRPLILPEITYVSGFRPWQCVFFILALFLFLFCIMSNTPQFKSPQKP